jgi:hypothetical protein
MSDPPKRPVHGTDSAAHGADHYAQRTRLSNTSRRRGLARRASPLGGYAYHGGSRFRCVPLVTRQCYLRSEAAVRIKYEGDLHTGELLDPRKRVGIATQIGSL